MPETDDRRPGRSTRDHGTIADDVETRLTEHRASVGADLDLDSAGADEIAARVLEVAPKSGAEADQFVLSALRRLVAPARIDARVHCEALLAAVAFLYRRGRNLEHALEGSVVSTALAARANLDDLACRARTASAIIMTAQDNLGAAIECFVDALEISLKMADPVAEQKSWHNIAAALVSARMFPDAAEAFRRSLALAARNPADDVATAELWANVAYCALEQEDFETGIDAVSRAVALLPDPATPAAAMSRCIAESTYVRLLLRNGEVSSARARAGTMPGFARRAASARSDLRVRSTEALIEAACGDYRVARQLALDLIEQARSLGTEALVAQLEVGIEVAGARGDIGQGVRHLRELALVLQSMQIASALKMGIVSRHLQASTLYPEARLPGAGDPWALLESIAVMPELRHGGTQGSMFRVGRLAALISAGSRGAGSAGDDAGSSTFERAARLHNIGNAVLPDAILREGRERVAEEEEIARTHTESGARIIGVFEASGLDIAARIARSHHESWDGSGYSGGLAGAAIPLEARIVALAVRFDGLINPPAGATALAVGDALQVLRTEAGQMLDPALVPIAFQVIVGLLRDHPDLRAYLSAAVDSSPLAQATRRIREALRAPLR
jgi:HD-GYP domain-containing protein (c-di-GMP phosphodiesterase class II)